MVKSGSWRVILPHQIRQTYPVYLALTASAGLMALYFPRLPFWNFPHLLPAPDAGAGGM